KLRYASHVGSGFTGRTLEQVQSRLKPLQTRACPFVEKPPLNAPTTWVKPELVAELKFHEWTGDGALRAPVFLRLRDDIDVKSVRRTESKPPQKNSAHGSGIDAVLNQLQSKKNAFELI